MTFDLADLASMLTTGSSLLSSVPHSYTPRADNTEGQVLMMSKVQCLFCCEKSTTEGRGEEKGGSANFQK